MNRRRSFVDVCLVRMYLTAWVFGNIIISIHLHCIILHISDSDKIMTFRSDFILSYLYSAVADLNYEGPEQIQRTRQTAVDIIYTHMY
jgi:hypothetical protein